MGFEMTLESINGRHGLLDLGAPVHFAVDKKVTDGSVWVCLFQQHAHGLEGVSHDVAATLLAKGRVGQVAGDMRNPQSVRLVVSVDAATALDVAIRRQILVPSAAAFGKSAPQLKFMDPQFPVAGTKIAVRVNGESLEGVVTGHDIKDGRTILDVEGDVVHSDGSRSLRNFWAWPEQVVQAQDLEALQDDASMGAAKKPGSPFAALVSERLESVSKKVVVFPSGTGEKYVDPLDVTSRPLAAPGLNSYRCKQPFGWVMIGAKDDADALIEARRSYAAAKPEDLQQWDGNGYVPLQRGKDRAMAQDSYTTSGCSALMGSFLFKHGARIDGPGEAGAPLQFCVGDRKWVPCPRGMVDVIAVFRQQRLELDSMGMRLSDWELCR